jgi:hypothetical protein|tara:strand:- start:284 stop:598 length:315 start_codon:yes stop_codon:yes gene_type:complete
MVKFVNENTGFKLSIKTLIAIGIGMATIISMWFMLKADIDEARDLPKNEWNPEWKEKLPVPDISRIEFDMKDELIRQTIMNTLEDIKEIKEDLKRMEDKIDQLR